MRFLGLVPGDKVPDKNTIWEFKKRLGPGGVADLLADLDATLGSLGIHGKEGVTVDATFVDVPRPRDSREDNATIKEGKPPADWEESSRQLCQKDLDVRWGEEE